jgi:hypothetical protein
LVVAIKGWDRVWAVKSRLEIPLDHVTSIRAAADEVARGIRIPGTHIPGVISAGTFYHMGKKVFWAVQNSERAIAIDLHDQDYSTLVVEVLDPDATIREVERAVEHVNV